MKKYIILASLILLISCKVKTPIVKLTTSDKYEIVLLNDGEKDFWIISIPFEITITNPSYKKRRLSYYKYYCNKSSIKKKKCYSAIMYGETQGILNKKYVWNDNLKPKQTKKYIIYSRHIIDTLKYPRSFFKEYYQKLKESSLKDSLPVGTLAEFKKKHPKMIAHLLKKDSIYFRFPFPKRDKIRGLSEGVRVPVVY
ncbi:Probable lipoprotein precursor [Tenacibaculum maritimum]|uniref:hypothetical protein n=1 Tax=Tenacibaculum maritimum TaxID=107401 RepID=UPI0012E4C059|nr:hypothetical protein [Tenacibaculum maritimum]CAA0236480.1 Probable lipoprotein precursor [Tenacibaculum maritimum]